ncbi:MAG TPA: ABC transporter permease [Vicinamibacterales bacterium]|nr:ABC transporter permease [Vicinamibacterales bacterium]
MIGRIRTLMWKEFLELRRTPRLFGLVLVAPVIQLTMLGYAATTDVRDVPVVIVDGDRSPASRRLLERFQASGHFRIVGEETRYGNVTPWLESGRAWLAIIVPAGFGRALDGAGDPARRVVQVLADGTDANSSGVALSYVARVVNEFNTERVVGRGGAPGGIDGRVRVWFNPELESRDFMVPGVIALLLLVITANLSSMAIVREREVGTLEQLNVTPLGRWELILGKLLPYGVVGFVDVLLVLAVAVFWFEVPLRGSVTLLLGASLVYLVCTLGLGLFVSTISATQQQANMTSTFFFLVPMVYLSGFVFPIENMPGAIQTVTYAIPLRYFLVIVRGVFLKGVGLEVLWPQLAALGAWGAGIVTLAALRVQKRG